MDDYNGLSDTYRGSKLINGRYRLTRKIAEGGMGHVWEALDSRVSGQRVAIKFLVTAPNPSAQEENRMRFQTEAAILARLQGPSIVGIRDRGMTAEGQLYIVMDYLEGRSLSQALVRNGRLTVRETLQILREVTEALEEAHSLDLVHRDLKPGNIFLQSLAGGNVKVRILDFGIAKVLGGRGQTQTGMFVGTPPYMAPEQFDGLTGPSIDLYALGVVAYECLSGERPFDGDLLTIVTHHAQFDPPPKFGAHLGIPTSVENLIFQLLEKDLQSRPPSARHLRKLIDELLTSQNTSQNIPTTERNPLPLPIKQVRENAARPTSGFGWRTIASKLLPPAVALAGALTLFVSLRASTPKDPPSELDSTSNPVQNRSQPEPEPPPQALVRHDGSARPSLVPGSSVHPRPKKPRLFPFHISLRGFQENTEKPVARMIRAATHKCQKRELPPTVRIMVFADGDVRTSPQSDFTRCLSKLIARDYQSWGEVASRGVMIQLKMRP